jgi:hypothetical protein
MGADTVLPPLRPWLWRPRRRTGDETAGYARMRGEQRPARRGPGGRRTRRATPVSGPRSPWRRVLSAFATGGKRTRPAVSHRVPRRTLFVSCTAGRRLVCMRAWRGSDATRRTRHASRAAAADGKCGVVWAAVPARAHSHS